MKYKEFKALLGKLWEVHGAISSDSDGTLISNWNSSHKIDEAIQQLEESHPRLTTKYYSEKFWGGNIS